MRQRDVAHGAAAPIRRAPCARRIRRERETERSGRALSDGAGAGLHASLHEGGRLSGAGCGTQRALQALDKSGGACT